MLQVNPPGPGKHVSEGYWWIGLPGDDAKTVQQREQQKNQPTKDIQVIQVVTFLGWLSGPFWDG